MDVRVLVVEDDPDLREALVDTLELADFDVTEADCGEAAIACISGGSFDLIVSDVNMPGIDGHELLKHVVNRHPGLPVLLITAYGSISNAVDAMRQGAVDYLVKPFEPDTLVDLVRKYAKGQAEQKSDDPVMVSDRSQHAFGLAKRVAVTDSTVLIAGESGSGKEVIASYIHKYSHRADQPFIAINCAAIPESMLEATLFGHEKGAFTGAVNSAPGKFEQANGGTLLLDEISEMALDLQAKLLRVLQEQEVERVGGRKTIKLDVRVIATTNRNMQQYIADGKFREDLFYRLNVFPITLAPLRERADDVVPLAERLFGKHTQKMGRPGVRLSDSAKIELSNYLWPGNVRELENVVQRALVLQPGDIIEAEDLCIETGSLAEKVLRADVSVAGEQGSGGQSFKDVSVMSSQPKDQSSGGVLESGSLGDDLQQKEFEMIIAVLKEERGRKNKAAERLGISPRTLRYKMAKMRDAGIDVDKAIAMI
ncbi:sigma-54-dependent transcriptional regulator [Oceanospirillum sediminis]|uniref:Sigma-54-dependent Fis family transcriptional regulator n=1 Tax=Oceanospirillum sediminis TaxID=2760088 RepID=A0A839IMA9_9GAMM|nr:sigma-54 dependent transcriptional regulator [Oceanospirillum sediminis]MBB1485652.1 sigma-54-dependent Fis family transcriptional regulator [Oceanospirillum sediminis]